MLKCTHAKSNIDIDTTDWSQYIMTEFKALTILFQESNTNYLIDQLDLDKLFEENQHKTQLFYSKKTSTKFPPLNVKC